MGSDYRLDQADNADLAERSLLIADVAARLIAGNRMTVGHAIETAITYEAEVQVASLDIRGVHQVAVESPRFEGRPPRAQVAAIGRRILPQVRQEVGVLEDE